MNYTEVVYSRTKNLGSYESEKIELRCALDEAEDVENAIALVKMKALEALGIIPKVEDVKEVVEGGNVKTKEGKVVDPSNGETVEEAKPKKKKAAKKATRKKSEKAPKESVKKEEPECKREYLAKVYTIGEVKESLKKVWKARGKSVAMDILKEIGKVTKSDELPENLFGNIVAECEKVMS